MSVSNPPARTTDHVDELAGVRFPDPYRWLEGETDEVRRWQEAQAEAATAHVRDWPYLDGLRSSVAKFHLPRFEQIPRTAGGRWFRTAVPKGASQAQVVVAEEPYGDGRVLFDPANEDPGHPPLVSWIAPAPDASVVAVGLCADGSEQNTIRLIEVASGAVLPDPPGQPLMDNWTGGVQWLPDSSGFFFTAIDGSAVDLSQRVWLHRRLPEISTTVMDIDWLPGTEYRMVVVSLDGRHAVAVQRLMNPVPVAVAPLEGSGVLEWRPFLTEIDDTVAGYALDGEWIAVTDVGAPRGRVVGIPLNGPTPNQPSSWREIVPESDATLRSLTPVGDLLYLIELVDTYAKIRMVDRSGTPRGQVPLPRHAAIEFSFPIKNVVPADPATAFIFSFSTLTESAGVYRHRPGSTTLDVLRAPKATLDDAVIEDGWATSADGTLIPYHLVRRRDVTLNRSRPTLMFAYGGWNVARAPAFPGAMAAFVAAGGVFVHCHLRGGAEFGRTWWEGGRMKNKPNCYADLYAIAEHLIVAGITTPNQLALTGGSNGGLMCGNAITQRPRLWAAVIPRMPLLDLVGACREAYGRWLIDMELADSTDPDEVRRLAGFSPYHLIIDGEDYPAMYIDAGGTDPRCPPWHARKFAARMQAATSGDAPILLRVWPRVGHGWATDEHTAEAENTEWLAFAMKAVGLEPAVPA